jgi:solute carrier family 25 aspartate/glutamate transporter 12/13
MEMVKIRQQMQGPAEEGHEKKSALQIAKELGPAGLYQGSVATLLREIPSSAIFFGCYIVLKDAFPDQPFVAGCLAAAPSAFLCTPMDVVKTRMRLRG